MNRYFLEFLAFFTLWVLVGGWVILRLNGRIQPRQRGSILGRLLASRQHSRDRECCIQVPCSVACAYWHQSAQDVIDSVGGIPGPGGPPPQLEDHPADRF